MKQGPMLGLAVSALSLRPGQTRTFAEMKLFCDAAGEPISRERLRQIEFRALKKIRLRLMCDSGWNAALKERNNK